jgi:predicted transglutaminase-like cysteine proteinase
MREAAMFVGKREITARIIVPAILVILGISVPREFSEPLNHGPASKSEKNIKKKSVAHYRPVVTGRTARQEPQAGSPSLLAVAQEPLFKPRIDPATKPSDGSVFASVAFQIGGLPIQGRWAAVTAGALDTSCGAACPSASGIAAAIDSVRDKPVAEKLTAINAAVNHAIVYTKDQDVYGKRDHWARPAETLSNGKGDCEDFAILKMAALKAAGVPTENMTLVVLRDTRRNLFHAVLSVSTDRGQLVLDNLRDDVPRDTALRDYQALYSMSEGRSFIHGYPTGSRMVSGGSTAIGAAQPGEGVEQRS